MGVDIDIGEIKLKDLKDLLWPLNWLDRLCGGFNSGQYRAGRWLLLFLGVWAVEVAAVVINLLLSRQSVLSIFEHARDFTSPFILSMLLLMLLPFIVATITCGDQKSRIAGVLLSASNGVLVW